MRRSRVLSARALKNCSRSDCIRVLITISKRLMFAGGFLAQRRKEKPSVPEVFLGVFASLREKSLDVNDVAEYFMS